MLSRVVAVADENFRIGLTATAQTPTRAGSVGCGTNIGRADRVLLVFTETYARRFLGKEAPGKGLGVTFEGVIISQTLYESGIHNAKFRAVVFREEDEGFIPLELRRVNRYRVDAPEIYQKLLRWLHDKPEVEVPPVGPKPEFSPPLGQLKGVPDLPRHYSPRQGELAVLRQKLLAGDESVAITGMGGIGKTVLASALAHEPEVRQALPDGIYWLTIGQKPNLLDLQNQRSSSCNRRSKLDLQLIPEFHYGSAEALLKFIGQAL
jgi:hypothetical protein